MLCWWFFGWHLRSKVKNWHIFILNGPLWSDNPFHVCHFQRQKILPLLTPYNHEKLQSNTLPLHQVGMCTCASLCWSLSNSMRIFSPSADFWPEGQHGQTLHLAFRRPITLWTQALPVSTCTVVCIYASVSLHRLLGLGRLDQTTLCPSLLHWRTPTSQRCGCI